MKINKLPIYIIILLILGSIAFNNCTTVQNTVFKRQFVSLVPGTMDSLGLQSIPAHTCTAKGKVYFTFGANRDGTINSVEYLKGENNECMVSTGKVWIKKYVKLTPSNSVSFGVYEIVF